MNKVFCVGLIAVVLSSLQAPAQEPAEGWKQLKVLDSKGRVTDRSQLRSWTVYVVKPQDGEEKEILLNLPYDTEKAFDSWQDNQNPGPALQRLETELSTRRAEYVAALNSGPPERIDAATKTLEATKEQLTRLRDLSAPNAKDEGFPIRARPTGKSFENLEIWDCVSQKEVDAAYAVALKARKEQDARQAEARTRLKADQELAAKNDPDGIFKMAERYYLGDRLAGINRDLAKAHSLYERAASMGHTDAAIALKHWQPQNPPGR